MENQSRLSAENRDPGKHCIISVIRFAPREIRTPDLMVRSHPLYPAELRALESKCTKSQLPKIVRQLIPAEKPERGSDGSLDEVVDRQAKLGVQLPGDCTELSIAYGLAI